MADPLTQVANEFSPVERGNMFDPTMGRDVIARYGMAGMRGADLERNLRLSGLARNERLGSLREQEEVAAAPLRGRKMELESEKLDLEEQDVLARRELMMAEGDLAREFWVGLDPEDPDYENNFRSMVSSLPPGATESPALKPALEYHTMKIKDRVMQDRWMAQESERKNRMAMSAGYSALRAAGLDGKVDAAQEDRIRSTHTDPATGEVNWDGYMADLYAAAGRGKMEDFKTKEQIKAGNAIERIRAYRDPAKRSRAIEDFKSRTDKKVETMRNAFPPQIDALRIGYAASQLGDKATGTKADIAALLERDSLALKDLDEKLDPLAVAEAKALDSDIAFSEEQFALNYDNMEDYVDLVPKLNDREKEARRDKWRAAHEAWDTSDEAVDAPRVDMPGFEAEERPPEAATEGKALDQATAAEFFRQAGGDRDKARQLARDAGYVF